MQETKVADIITRRAAELPWTNSRRAMIDGKQQWERIGEDEPWEMRHKMMMSPAGDETLYLNVVEVGPNWREPKHYHTADEMCYIVAGTIENGGQVFEAGDVIHTKEGTQYSLKAGPEGATFLVIRARASELVNVEEGWA